MTDAWRTAPGLDGSLPRPDRPLLVTMLTGWIDASGAAAAAIDLLATLTGAETVVEFDEDTFIDYRARRPILHSLEQAARDLGELVFVSRGAGPGLVGQGSLDYQAIEEHALRQLDQDCAGPLLRIYRLSR